MNKNSIPMTDEDRYAINRFFQSSANVKQFAARVDTACAMRAGDEADELLMCAAVRDRAWNRGKPVATSAPWMLAHQGFTDPLNPGMDSIPASDLGEVCHAPVPNNAQWDLTRAVIEARAAA